MVVGIYIVINHSMLSRTTNMAMMILGVNLSLLIPPFMKKN